MCGLKVPVVVSLAVVLLSSAQPAQAAFPGENARIAYTRVSDHAGITSTDIHTVEPNGDADLAVTSTGTARGPAFSPDGMRLAFVDTGGIYTSDQYGGNRTLVFAWSAPIEGIDWSPDGERLAASLMTCDEDCHFDVHVINLPTGTVTDVTPDFFDELRPSWSPDGSRIIFGTARAGELDIYAVVPDGSGLTNLTSGIAVRAVEPDWSPDGGRIVFATEDQSGSYTINPDGSGQTSAPVSRTPAWSPDGRRFVSSYFDQLRTIGVDGSDLTTIGFDARSPDWQPSPAQPEPPPSGSGYPRPRGASPFRVPLVVAYPECRPSGVIDPNSQHGAPLAYPSCSPPVSWGEFNDGATVGTPDANGLAAQAVGFVEATVVPGDSSTPSDEADVRLTVQQSDVWSRGFSPTEEYAGDLLVKLPLRITDRYSSGGADASATVADAHFEVPVPCAPTASSAGSACAVATTADTLVPGTVREGKRSIWQLGRIEVYDGGLDDTLATRDDNILFATQGLFMP